MRQLSCVLALVLTATLSLGAQQLDLTSMYRYNWQLLNPAAVNYIYLDDHDKQYSFHSSYRQQWLGFKGAPATYNARFESLATDANIKWGLFASGDRAGAVNTHRLFLNFAYLIYFKRSPRRRSFLSMGLSMGGARYKINMSEIRFQENQPNFVPEGATSHTYADMAFGAFYRWKDLGDGAILEYTLTEFYLGLSVPQTFTLDFGSPQEDRFQIDRIRHYYFIGGFIYHINSALAIEPSVWLRYIPANSFQTLLQNTPFSADVNVRMVWDKRFWGGFGLSTNRSIHGEAGFNLGKGTHSNSQGEYTLTLGLAYDVPVGWQQGLGQSVEICLGVGWN